MVTLMLHRTRDLLVRQQTALINALRGHLAEFGLIAAKGISKFPDLVALVQDQSNSSLPDLVRRCAKTIIVQIEDLRLNLAEIDQEIQASHKANKASQRLAKIPGIGPITASAIVAKVSDPSVFQSGRDFAAWIGLVPRLSGTGGKVHLGHISKQGDRYLRRLLYLGAVSLICASRNKATALSAWINRLLAAKPAQVVAIAGANKLARVA
jgi:transposase